MMIVGFVLTALTIGWTDGSYNDLIDKFTRASFGHIQIHADDYFQKPTLYKTIDNYNEIGEKIMSVENVEAWSPRLYSAGLGSVGDKATGVQVIGIDPALESKATNFPQKIKEGKDDFGYNARTEKYENLFETGIIDPLKVGRVALTNATSVSSLLLTTEAAIFEIPEEKSASADMGGGMPGMGMM
jgi:hypothetical protein